jgi:pyruvate dehydrogenase E2 component (dihydrolipoamide acetyltransferase)/2-oxoglutarate dehydrogenase E2 component (dihydrolipoamide succinyltransferase)
MAQEQGIDLASVTGTGPGGRIVKEDVEQAIANKGKALAGPPVEQAPAAREHDGKKVKAAIPIKSGMRRAIAEHLQRSLAISAQLTVTGEIDMTEIMHLRAEFLKQEEALQTRITYTDIFILAITRALRDNPGINSSLVGDEIIVWEDINIGIAVALEGDEFLGGGLIVPVLKNADKLSLAEISRAAKPLIGKAREGKIMPDDVSGGTFTLTNLGVAGGGYGFGTPIINQPESAILATGAISDRPVVRDGEIVIRPIMAVSLTIDHRVIDGYPASIFMSRLTELLENPLLLL